MTDYLQTLRKASIVDVNSAALFLSGVGREGAEDVSSDPETPETAEASESQIAALRLFLSHVALEHGELWLSDDEVGIQAAALWLPSQPDQFGDEIRRVFRRELGLNIAASNDHAAQATSPGATIAGTNHGVGTDHSIGSNNGGALVQDMATEILAMASTTNPELILTDVALAADIDPASADGATLVRDLLRPVLSSPVHSRFAAISIDDGIVAVLCELGFRTVTTVVADGGAVVWIGQADLGVHTV